jgi:hypothetical protein
MIPPKQRAEQDRKRREMFTLLGKLVVGEPVDYTQDGRTSRMVVTRELHGEPVGYHPDGSIMLGGSWENAHSVMLTLEGGTYTRRVSAGILTDWSYPPTLTPVWTDAERQAGALFAFGG